MRYVLVCSLVAVLMSACTGGTRQSTVLPDANHLSAPIRGVSVAPGAFDETRLVYEERLRGFTYEGVLLRNELGKKVANQELAVIRLTGRRFDETKKLSNTILKGTGAVLMAPSFIVGGAVAIPLAVAVLPGGLVYALGDDSDLDEVLNYSRGLTAYREKDCRRATEYFLGVLHRNARLALYSDVYYWLGKCYDTQGKIELATGYYRSFIEYSEREVPEEFSKHDKTLTHDVARLDSKFDEAEARLDDLGD